MDTFDLYKDLTVGAFFNRGGNQEQRDLDTTYDSPQSSQITLLNTRNVRQSTNSNKYNSAYIDDNDLFVRPIEMRYRFPRKNTIDRAQLEKTALLRRRFKIYVKGERIPPPIASFEELDSQMVSPTLIANIMPIKRLLPTSIQMQAIPIMLKGRHLLACAPTGSGKTLAYLLPVINELGPPSEEGARAIILCPTRELGMQIYRECLRLSEHTGLRIFYLSRTSQLNGPIKKFDVLITNPGKIIQLLGMDTGLLDLASVEWLVVDEADQIMAEGDNNFQSQFFEIFQDCTHPKLNVSLFSATHSELVEKWAYANLKKVIRVRVGMKNSATDVIRQELLFVGSEAGKLVAIRDLMRIGLRPPVLVFVQSKDRAKQLFTELLYDGINVDVIHADRTQAQRNNVVEAFRLGRIWILICTDLMGRGIDFKGVNLVINYDLPQTTISYIHRIGRTGRADRPGRAITFFTQDDIPNLRGIAQLIKNGGGVVPNYLFNFSKKKSEYSFERGKSAPKRDFISTNAKQKERRKAVQKKGRFVRAPPKIQNETEKEVQNKAGAKQLKRRKKLTKKSTQKKQKLDN